VFLWESQEEMDHWKDLDLGERIFLRDRFGLYGLDSSGSEWRQVESSCERGNECSGSIKYWEIF
jgi:hypothetical protein